MKKFFMFISLFFLCNIAKATDFTLSAFVWIDDTYLHNLETCTHWQKIQTLQFGEEKINLYQEIDGLTDNRCKFSLGVVEEYFLQCNLPQEQLNVVVKYLKDKSQPQDEFAKIINNPEYCQINATPNDGYFKDSYGVEFSCDTPLNIQMVSDEECRKCSNRTLVEDSKIVLSDHPLTYCVLKFCPQGYIKNQDGQCIKQN